MNDKIKNLLARDQPPVFLVVRVDGIGNRKTMWAGSSEETARMLAHELCHSVRRGVFHVDKWQGNRRQF